MQAGIGGILTSLDHGHAQYVIGAVVFTSRAVAEDRDSTWMRWGTLLALHGDLDDDTWSQWMTGDRSDGLPAWISLQALREETCNRIMREARRRRDALHNAEYTLEERNMAREAGKIGSGYIGRKIMRRAQEDFIAAQSERWPDINGVMLGRCASSVLQEFRCDERCGHCGGTGIMPYVLDDRRREVPCAGCYGTGVTRASDRDRARSIEVPWSTYKRAWKRPYDWLYQEALTARRQAVRHLREQLSE